MANIKHIGGWHLPMSYHIELLDIILYHVLIASDL